MIKLCSVLVLIMFVGIFLRMLISTVDINDKEDVVIYHSVRPERRKNPSPPKFIVSTMSKNKSSSMIVGEELQIQPDWKTVYGKFLAERKPGMKKNKRFLKWMKVQGKNLSLWERECKYDEIKELEKSGWFELKLKEEKAREEGGFYVFIEKYDVADETEIILNAKNSKRPLTDKDFKTIRLAIEIEDFEVIGCDKTNITAKGFECLKNVSISSLTLKNLNLDITALDSLFQNCSKLVMLDIENIKLPKTDPFRLISNMSKLLSLIITEEMLTEENITRLMSIESEYLSIIVADGVSDELLERINGRLSID
jgi:hypothetical protein